MLVAFRHLFHKFALFLRTNDSFVCVFALRSALFAVFSTILALNIYSVHTYI